MEDIFQVFVLNNYREIESILNFSHESKMFTKGIKRPKTGIPQQNEISYDGYHTLDDFCFLFNNLFANAFRFLFSTNSPQTPSRME